MPMTSTTMTMKTVTTRTMPIITKMKLKMCVGGNINPRQFIGTRKGQPGEVEECWKEMWMT